MAYIGRPLNAGNLAVQSGTGDGSDTTPIATLDYSVGSSNSIAVYLDGVRQLAGTDFTASGTALTFTTAPANGVGVDVYFLGLEVSIPTPADSSVSTAKLANNAVDETKLKDALIGDFTDATVTASDTFLYGDATDSGNTKRDTVQGILDLAGGGAWAVKASGTLSTASELQVTGLTKTTKIFMDITVSADGVYPTLQTSSDNGSSYDSTSGDYDYTSIWGTEASTSVTGVGNAESTVQFSPSPNNGVGNATGETCSMEWTIYNPAGTTQTLLECRQITVETDGAITQVWSAGKRESNADVDAVRIYPRASGTFSGTYTVIELN